MRPGKVHKPKGSNSTKYGEKTSEHGHYAPKHSYAGTNSDGSSWRSHEMEWVEDNRDFTHQPSDPSPQPKPKQDLVIESSRPKNQTDRNGENSLAPRKPLPTPVNPNGDYSDLTFSNNESKIDYTFTPQAQEAKERAANFKNASDRP